MAFDLKGMGNVKKDGSLRIRVYEHKMEDGVVISELIFTIGEAQWDKVNSADDVFSLAGQVPIKDKPIEYLINLKPSRW